MRERALWRVGPYLRPHTKRIGFIAGSALLSIGAQLVDPAHREGRDRRPDPRRQQARARAAVRARGRARPLRAQPHVPRAGSRSRTSRPASRPRLRDDFYEHLQRLEVGFHDRWQSGQLLSRANSDISLIRRFAAFGAIFLVIIIVEVIAIFALLLHLDVWLGLLTICDRDPGARRCAAGSNATTTSSCATSRTRPATSRR